MTLGTNPDEETDWEHLNKAEWLLLNLGSEQGMSHGDDQKLKKKVQGGLYQKCEQTGAMPSWHQKMT